MKKTAIGIDVAKKSFVAAIKINNKIHDKLFSNNHQGFKEFLDWLERYGVNNGHICMESTGKYGQALAHFLYNNNHLVSIVNPAKIKYFMQSQSARNKTDKADARYIRYYCELFNPTAWQPLTPETRVLQELVKRLDTVDQMILEEKNRLEEVDESVQESINNHIEYLKKEHKTLEKTIETHIQSHEPQQKSALLLKSIPGIGKKTISKTIAFLNNTSAFENAKQLAAFIGLNPKQAQSGTSLNYSHLSKMGDPKLRRMFYMPALVAIQREPKIKAFYEKLVNKGKPKKVAICAVMRKLVHIIYGVLKSQTPYNSALLSSV